MSPTENSGLCSLAEILNLPFKLFSFCNLLVLNEKGKDGKFKIIINVIPNRLM